MYCERVVKCSECCQKLKMEATSMFCLFYENASGIMNVTTPKLEIIPEPTARSAVRGYHRYRRPRLLTVMYSTTHVTRQHEHSKWRLNRSKIIERDREKPCFSHFTPAYCFRSRSTTLFGEELTAVKVLDEYLYNLSSIKTK